MFGLNFVEILVSLILLSLLLLGTEAIQYIALRDTKTAYYVSVAHTQLNNMAERIKLGLNEDVNKHVKQWNEQNKVVLPSGKGTINRDGSLYILSLFWGSAKNGDECDQNKIGPSGCLRLVINSVNNTA